MSKSRGGVERVDAEDVGVEGMGSLIQWEAWFFVDEIWRDRLQYKYNMYCSYTEGGSYYEYKIPTNPVLSNGWVGVTICSGSSQLLLWDLYCNSTVLKVNYPLFPFEGQIHLREMNLVNLMPYSMYSVVSLSWQIFLVETRGWLSERLQSLM